MPASLTSLYPPTLSKPDEPSPLLNLTIYPPTVRSLSTWTLTLPRVSIPSEWTQKSALWREEQIQAMREEQWRYRQRWLVAACAARSSQTRGPCTCRGYHCPGTSEATCAFRNSIRMCNTHGTRCVFCTCLVEDCQCNARAAYRPEILRALEGVMEAARRARLPPQEPQVTLSAQQ